MRRQDVLARKKEPCRARQHCGREKKRGRGSEFFRTEHAEQDDKPGKNSYQAQRHMNQSKCCERHSEDHRIAPFDESINEMRRSTTCFQNVSPKRHPFHHAFDTSSSASVTRVTNPGWALA